MGLITELEIRWSLRKISNNCKTDMFYSTGNNHEIIDDIIFTGSVNFRGLLLKHA